MPGIHSDHTVTDARQPLTLPASADGLAVFLDVDGTLVEIAGSPEEVRVEARLHEVLNRLRHRLDGAVALVSGRRIADLERLFALSQLPMAGLHGLERCSVGGAVISGAAAALSLPEREQLVRFAAEHPGVLLEDKGAAVALHYRAAPEVEVAARALARAITAANADEMVLLEGKMVLEIRRRGSHKGDAIADFMNEPPFAGRRPVFIGDDVTDEDGFAVVNRMAGWSVRVGESGTTAARFRLPNVGAVIAWLDALVRPDFGGAEP
jgi:trehalose 6-phosphate phosphatase